jgi:hypothetical protein
MDFVQNKVVCDVIQRFLTRQNWNLFSSSPAPAAGGSLQAAGLFGAIILRCATLV